MIKCKECGKDISTEAKVCPNCGAKSKKNVGILGVIFAGLFGLMVFTCNSPNTTSPKPEPTAAEKAASAKRELVFQKVVLALKTIKSSARNPDSIAWESIDANEDGSVICVAYRGQNGFGGMSKEVVVLAKGKASQTADAWNKSCAHKPLSDMMHARHAL